MSSRSVRRYAWISAALLALTVIFAWSSVRAASAEPRPDEESSEKPRITAGFGMRAIEASSGDEEVSEDGEEGLRGGVVSVRVLPGPAGEPAIEDKPEERPSADRPTANREPEQRAEPEQKAKPEREAKPEAEQKAEPETPRDDRLWLSVPRLGMKGVAVGDSPDQSYLDREGIMHLSGTGFPSEEGSNTYIAGHAIGYPGGRVPYAFYDLKDLREGDSVKLRDATGKTYEYRVYKRLFVDPSDVWVTDPVPGKEIVSLQTCFPEPTWEKRLVVRAELVG